MRIKKALEKKKSLIPKEGFNVVGIDRMAEPDDALYFIEHFEKEDAAKAEKKKQEKKGVTCFIYDKDTH